MEERKLAAPPRLLNRTEPLAIIEPPLRDLPSPAVTLPPVMVVTVLPPRPLLSRRTRAIPSPSGILVCLQVQASTGSRHSGQ